MGLRVRATPQGPYHNSYYFPSVAHFSLGNLIKLTLSCAGRKQQLENNSSTASSLHATR